MTITNQQLDDRAVQVLSISGAMCGVCGDEPGDRNCADCERVRRGYIRDLRAAGWAPRDEPPTTDFFQVGHAYKHASWTFRVDAITSHPDTGERTVLGWFRFLNDSWRPLSCGEAEWAEGVWTDITTDPANQPAAD